MTSNQTPAGFAPVVTEEMVNALGLELQGYRSGIFEDPISSEDAEAALTAALPHIVEGMAREADAKFAREYPAGAPRSASSDAARADYLRSLAPMGEKA